MRRGGNKTKKSRKRKAEEANLAEVDDEEVEAEGGRKELVNLEDIEMIYKKKRHDKEVRDIYPPLNTYNSLIFFLRQGWPPSKGVEMRRRSSATRTKRIQTHQRPTSKSQRRRTSQ